MPAPEQPPVPHPTPESLVDWRDARVPVSRRFDDPYFSLQGGLDETRHVFLAGNGLPERLTDGFQIAELGFGTGLNLLVTLLAAPENRHLQYTSFEAYPLPAEAIARALSAFPALDAVSGPFLRQWQAGATTLTFPGLTARVILGDARLTLPMWSGKADAWYLDGFSPAKNPELWSAGLMHEVARHTAPDGTFATYTAAGHVRRSLAEAGFDVERRPGFGRKRHMTTGRMISR